MFAIIRPFTRFARLSADLPNIRSKTWLMLIMNLNLPNQTCFARLSRNENATFDGTHTQFRRNSFRHVGMVGAWISLAMMFGLFVLYSFQQWRVVIHQ